jgi:hypothetical protein
LCSDSVIVLFEVFEFEFCKLGAVVDLDVMVKQLLLELFIFFELLRLESAGVLPEFVDGIPGVAGDGMDL